MLDHTTGFRKAKFKTEFCILNGTNIYASSIEGVSSIKKKDVKVL